MRVVTFNIFSGRAPGEGRVHVDRLARSVASLEADLLALQEVDRAQPRSGGVDLAGVAAEAMRARDHRFVAAVAGTPGEAWRRASGEEAVGEPAYGIALLSRYPVRSWRAYRLPPIPVPLPMSFPWQRRPALVADEPRVAVAAEVEAPGGPLTVVGTHLSFVRWSARRQLRRLVGATAGTAPLLLLGDLNLPPRAVARLTGLRTLATAPTFPMPEPQRQIDHVLARGRVGRVVAAGAVQLPVSDHRALVVDIEREMSTPRSARPA